MKNSKVVIEIKGGNIIKITSDNPDISYHIIDHDISESNNFMVADIIVDDVDTIIKE